MNSIRIFSSIVLILVAASTTACSHTPLRKEPELVESLNHVIIPEGWKKNPPGTAENIVYSAEFSTEPGSPKWRSGIVIKEGDISSFEIRNMNGIDRGQVITEGFPPVKSVKHISQFCVDMEFEYDPKATRNTPRTIFVCAANNTSLEMIESGYGRAGEVARGQFIRIIRRRIEG